METKPNLAEEAITHPISKNNIDTVNKTDKPQASKRKNINPLAKNKTKSNNWINQGLLKELKHKTQ